MAGLVPAIHVGVPRAIIEGLMNGDARALILPSLRGASRRRNPGVPRVSSG